MRPLSRLPSGKSSGRKGGSSPSPVSPVGRRSGRKGGGPSPVSPVGRRPGRKGGSPSPVSPVGRRPGRKDVLLINCLYYYILFYLTCGQPHVDSVISHVESSTSETLYPTWKATHRKRCIPRGKLVGIVASPHGGDGRGAAAALPSRASPTGETGEGLYLYTILSMRKLVGTATISTSTGATSRCMPTATKMLKSTMCSE